MGTQLVRRKEIAPGELERFELIYLTCIHSEGKIDNLLNCSFAYHGGLGFPNLGPKIAPPLERFADESRNINWPANLVLPVLDVPHDLLVVVHR